MDGSQPRKRSTRKRGLRALEASGDGFWELDLKDGSAWYSEWFYQKLGWPTETKRTTLGDMEPRLEPAAWLKLMGRIRAHLEEGRPLELDLEVRVPGTGPRCWRIQGSAHRNDAGQPVYLAGSMREVGPVADPSAGLSDRRGVHGAFDALPVAAALLDGGAALLEANRQWQDFPAGTTAQVLARLRTANSRTAVEFWLDPAETVDADPRRLRVRAVAFQHEGARHLAVTLEDRRSD